jgi:2-polyprenyl-6-methoxyphenol hydroxylase-like FAD-dependent oxidoreductase
MRAPLHIAVCGAGPAGLSAALALDRLGHRITLFEQFDTPKPLGSGLILQPTGLAVLDWLGVGERIRSLGARIDRLYGRASASGRVVLDVRYEALGAARGVAVHRAALFTVLHDAVTAAKITVETASCVSGLDRTSLILDKGPPRRVVRAHCRCAGFAFPAHSFRFIARQPQSAGLWRHLGQPAMAGQSLRCPCPRAAL